MSDWSRHQLLEGPKKKTILPNGGPNTKSVCITEWRLWSDLTPHVCFLGLRRPEVHRRTHLERQPSELARTCRKSMSRFAEIVEAKGKARISRNRVKKISVSDSQILTLF